MIKDRKILITGVTGVGPFPIARALAANNEVWGVARFRDPADVERVEAAGIRACRVDLASGDLTALPRDFDYLLHFAWWRAPLSQLDQAIRINVEGAGFALEHCRMAKAALVVSGMGVYGANADPWYQYSETDPIGRGATAYAETSPTCKVGLEAVARYCARSFGLPTTIARLNTVFGLPGTYHAKMILNALNDIEFPVPFDPNPHRPIHTLDMQDQIEALLDAASTPALITNWCGDEIVTTQEAAQQIEALTGKALKMPVRLFPGAPTGTCADSARRLSITGPCKTKFAPSLAELVKEIA